jgi:pimeloyl-ACP methyl ester carboxylesterase
LVSAQHFYLSVSLALIVGAGVLPNAAYLAGSIASAPASAIIGAPPAGLEAERVSIESASGSRLSGWFIPGWPGRGVVLLMHGIRANRLEMAGRARMLNAQGLSVLLFDFQAHGESPGERITFGFFESRDAKAAFEFLRQKLPAERLGVMGVSLGGAAAILSEKPLEADAMVLEAVFGSFDEALENRLTLRLEPLGSFVDTIAGGTNYWQRDGTFRGFIRGVSDINPCACARYDWLALFDVLAGEISIRPCNSPDRVAFSPSGRIKCIATHPNGVIFAAAEGCNLLLFRLEGGMRVESEFQ